MSKFKVGDHVAQLGVPFIVEVLEIGECDEVECHGDRDREIFRFKDPGGLGDDWMHTSDFDLAN